MHPSATANPPSSAPELPETAPRRRAPPLAGNIVRRLLGTGLRIAVGLITVPLYTRLIGMSQWGLLMLFQAAAAPLVLLDLGTGPAVVKLVSEALGRDDEESAARTVRAALSFNTVVLAVGASILLLLAPWFARSLFAIPPADLPVATIGFRLVAFSWASGAVLAFFSNVLVAQQRYDEVLRASTLALVASSAAGIGAAFITRNAASVLLAQSAATLLAALFTIRRAERLLHHCTRLQWDLAELRRLLRFGGWYTVANVGVLLASWSDRFVLGMFFVPRTVGFYSLAQSLQQQTYGLFFDAGDVLFPAVSHRQGMGAIGDARRLALLAGWTLTSAFGPVAVTLAIVGGDFLGLWISPEAAREATSVLRLLCAAGIGGLAGVAPIFFAMGTGRSHWQAPFSLVVGLVLTAGSVALVPHFGLRGIGLAFALAVAVRCGLVMLLWRALFRPDVSAVSFAIHIFAPASGALALLVAGVMAHDAIHHSPGWLALVVEGAAVFVTAALLQFGFGEALPNGRTRRRSVVESFRPVVVRAIERARGFERP